MDSELSLKDSLEKSFRRRLLSGLLRGEALSGARK